MKLRQAKKIIRRMFRETQKETPDTAWILRYYPRWRQAGILVARHTIRSLHRRGILTGYISDGSGYYVSRYIPTAPPKNFQ